MKPVLLILVSVLVVALALSVGGPLCREQGQAPPAAGLAQAQKGGPPGGPPGPPKVDIEPDTNKTGLKWSVDYKKAEKDKPLQIHPRFRDYRIKEFSVLIGKNWHPVKEKLEIRIKDAKGAPKRTVKVQLYKSDQGVELVRWFVDDQEVLPSQAAKEKGLPPEFWVGSAAGEWEMVANDAVVESRKAKIHLKK